MIESYSLGRGKTWIIWLSLAASVHFLSAGRGIAAEPVYPLGGVAGDQGPIYLADRNLPGILKLDGGALTVHFQADKKFRTPLNAVRCVALDKDGKLLAGDSSTREVYRFGDDGKPQPLTSGGIGIPMSIAVAATGEIYVADLELQTIWKVPSAGGKPEKFADAPAPRGLAFDAQQRLWVVSGGKDQLLRFGADGKSELVVKGRPFEFPHQVCLGEDGVAYVTDGYAKAVWKVTEGGEATKLAIGDPLVNPVGIFRQGSKLFIVDPRAKGLFELSGDGKLSAVPLK